MQVQPDIMAIMSAFLMQSFARHTTFNLTDIQKKLLAHPISKSLILFAMFYLSTRSIKWSLLLLIIYFLLIQMLLNEHHPLNVISDSFKDSHSKEKGDNVVDLYFSNLQKLKD